MDAFHYFSWSFCNENIFIRNGISFYSVFHLKILMFKSFVQLTLPFHPHNKNYRCWSDLYYVSSGGFHVNNIIFRIGSTKCILEYQIVKYVGLQCHILKAYFIFIYIYQKIVIRYMNNSWLMRNDLFSWGC